MADSVLQIEQNGINVISEDERKGKPRDLFWPWFAANISVLGLSYGAFLLDFGISFWQAVVVGLAGIVLSFLACGFIAVAGKRGSAPTMVLSRAPFGVRGNVLPSAISWLLTVGWETVLVILATLAVPTVFQRLGWPSGDPTKVIAMIVVIALTIGGGVGGFNLVMRMQTWITVITGICTVIFLALVADKIHWHTVSTLKAGSAQELIGGLVFMMTGFGLGWVNCAADYSRYLPRRASGGGIISWTTFGAAIAPVFLLVFGLLLAGSSSGLSSAIGANPIGALTTLLPKWFLVPFAIVAVLGLIGGSVLDIYSSGLALLTAGLKVPRYVAALIDGTVMTVGTIYVVFIASGDFFAQFQGFLITLGVPIAAWCGVMLADILLRRHAYAETELFSKNGRYGDVQPIPVLTLIVGTVIGWGLVTNTYAGWLTWQGYFLKPFGLGGKTGAWAGANLGVLVALAIGFVVMYVASRSRVRAEEAIPVPVEALRTRSSALVNGALRSRHGPCQTPPAAPAPPRLVHGRVQRDHARCPRLRGHRRAAAQPDGHGDGGPGRAVHPGERSDADRLRDRPVLPAAAPAVAQRLPRFADHGGVPLDRR
jgi:nucleobase:cation symporter-1, NCS1 family